MWQVNKKHYDIPILACGLALSSVLAVFSAWGWLSDPGIRAAPVFAALSLVVQIAANLAAAAARRARVLGLVGSFRWAVAICVALGGYNAFSLHHAFVTAGAIGPDAGAVGALVAALTVVLVVAEQPLYWIDEALKGEAREAPPLAANTEVHGLALRAVGGSALAAMSAAAEPPAVIQRQDWTQQQRPAPSSPLKLEAPTPTHALKLDGVSRERALALLRDRNPGTGKPRTSQDAIAAEVGIPRYWVRKLWEQVQAEDQSIAA